MLQTVLNRQYVDPAIDFNRFACLEANIALVNKNISDSYWPTNTVCSRYSGNCNCSTCSRQLGSLETACLQSSRGTAPTKLTADNLCKLYNKECCFVCWGKGHLSQKCSKTEDKSTSISNLANLERKTYICTLEAKWVATAPTTSLVSSWSCIEELSDLEN